MAERAEEAEAVKWLRRAADQGDADAQFKLGVMYAEGRGVTQDDTQAVKWFRRAADQGMPTPSPVSRLYAPQAKPPIGNDLIGRVESGLSSQDMSECSAIN